MENAGLFFWGPNRFKIKFKVLKFGLKPERFEPFKVGGPRDPPKILNPWFTREAHFRKPTNLGRPGSPFPGRQSFRPINWFFVGPQFPGKGPKEIWALEGNAPNGWVPLPNTPKRVSFLFPSLKGGPPLVFPKIEPNGPKFPKPGPRGTTLTGLEEFFLRPLGSQGPPWKWSFN